MMPSRRPWWSYLRLSLARLMLLILVLAVWLGWMVQGARIQREAVAAIRAAHGMTLYERPSRQVCRNFTKEVS